MSKKRGKLSSEEEGIIKRHSKDMSVKEIAKMLNRTTEPVEKFIKAHGLVHTGLSEDDVEFLEEKQKLKKSLLWTQIEQTFTNNELDYFVRLWIDLVGQFQSEGILTTEKLQMKQLITLQILETRLLRDNKQALEQLSETELELVAEEDKDESVQDPIRIGELRMERDNLRIACTSFSKAYESLLDRDKDINRQLKATRADRVKDIESSKDTWPAYLKYLENEEVREYEGKTIEIERMAADKAIEKLSEYHTFEDGQVDTPFLTPETVRCPICGEKYDGCHCNQGLNNDT